MSDDTSEEDSSFDTYSPETKKSLQEEILRESSFEKFEKELDEMEDIETQNTIHAPNANPKPLGEIFSVQAQDPYNLTPDQEFIMNISDIQNDAKEGCDTLSSIGDDDVENVNDLSNGDILLSPRKMMEQLSRFEKGLSEETLLNGYPVEYIQKLDMKLQLEKIPL